MPHPTHREPAAAARNIGRAIAVALMIAGGATIVLAQSNPPTQAPPPHVNRANWTLADRFNPAALRPVLYSTIVQPHWLGETDSLWYNWKDHNGSRFMLAVPPLNVKRPLFDHATLAAALTETIHKPYDATNLPFTTLTFTRDHRNIRFQIDSSRYEWNLAAEKLRSLGKMPRDSVLKDDQVERGGGRGGRGGGGFGFGQQGADFHNYSPDSTAFVFARDHNLYLVEVAKGDTVQISTDGVKDHSFGFRDTTFSQINNQQQDGEGQVRQHESHDPRVRPAAIWSSDSKAFAIVRMDQRKVNELYLVNVLSQPRPTLSAYRYAMPGEPNVPQAELYVYKRGDRSVREIDVGKWKDQRLMDVHWTTGSDKLRVVRRDRLQRDLDLIEVDLASNATRTLLTESIENASLDPQPVRYVKKGGDFLWWSERSGWGHYYIYDFNGTYKRPLDDGPWKAENIAAIDSVRGLVWLVAEGREPGENVYLQHLYRVNADGTGLTLLDAGNYNHAESISPTKRYSVDNYSRVDVPARAVVRDATGKVAMDLEEFDPTGLRALGWKPPETFVVKAADGVTDNYGNLWKPFDFDSTKKYPVIAHVYPGPQTESVNTTFVPGGVEQQLAQLGFIVIQIGNRGGSPMRSLAYHRYGYYNLRDYALADKKAGIEQLAAQHKWIDIDEVGIFGHSGGGFLTAAALLEPPYNDFFKVGVSSSGNHDNNIYNQNWSEWNQGMRVVALRGGADSARTRAGGRRGVPTIDGDNGAAVDDSLQYVIHVPTNIELAANLKGNLLLVTGDMDNNVHPGNTIRLVNALIRANKRFDFMLMPGKPHAYGDLQPYFNHLMMEYFAQHLLGDYYGTSAIIR